MKKAGLWGVLWMLFFSEVRDAAEPDEIKHVLAEGQDLREDCPFNIMKYAFSQKAWQRLEVAGEPQTLAVTESPSGEVSVVQVGKYILTDDPTEAMLHVQMTNLQVEDSGLYRCVIYQPPEDPILLHYPVRLVVTKDPSGTPAIPIWDNVPTFITTEGLSTTWYTNTIQPLPKSTAVTFSPDPGTNFTNVTDVTRVPVFSIIVAVVCGLLSKSLVFTVLLVVTQRSFGPRSTKPRW